MSQKPQKTRFCEVFGPKITFLQLKWSILFFAHLLHFNRRLLCKFELIRSNSASLPSVFLKLCRKNPKKHIFFEVFWAQNLLLSTKVVICFICALFPIQWMATLSVLAQWEQYSKFAMDFSEVLSQKPQKNPVFSTFFGPELKLF